ncbi:MAG: hypothetical protein ABI688_05135 [Bacteroidota bacterium]
MKNLRTIAACFSIALCSIATSAQTGDKPPVNEPNYNKPKLFQGLPENIPVSMENLSTLFDSQVGRAVSLNLAGDQSFLFEGDVVSSVSKYENTMQSVVIRSTNYAGARLSVTRTTDANGKTAFTGRIISMQHGDLFELKNINDQFVLVKRKFYDLLNE